MNDNCVSFLFRFAPQEITNDIYPIGTFEYSFSNLDSLFNGNVDVCTYTIEVKDLVAPVLSMFLPYANMCVRLRVCDFVLRK